MADGRECWDCFYCGKSYGNMEWECNRTHRRTRGDSSCSYFLSDKAPNAHACWECDYFGTYKSGSIFEKDNYCEKKQKVVDKNALACPYFIE